MPLVSPSSVPAPASHESDSELVTEIRCVMATVAEALGCLRAAQRAHVANALLNLAVSHLRRQEGDQRTAQILRQLSLLVAEGARPPADRPIPLAVPDA